MKIRNVRLNGGLIVHALDGHQKTFPADRTFKALCGKKPGSGTTASGARRARWLIADSKPSCETCIRILEEIRGKSDGETD